MLSKFLLSFLLPVAVTCVQLRAQDTLTTYVGGEMDATSRPFSYHCVIDSLGTGESIYIIWTTSGCVHGYSDSIWIGKTYNGFSVVYHNKKRSLSIAETNILRDFEYDVYKVSKTVGGCTTTEYYRYIRNGKSYLAASDDSCVYHLFSKLLEDLQLSSR